jgi:hypothetical protein
VTNAKSPTYIAIADFFLLENTGGSGVSGKGVVTGSDSKQTLLSPEAKIGYEPEPCSINPT